MLLLHACSKEEVPICENCNFTCLGANEPDVITNSCIDNWECSFSIIPKSQVDRTSGLTQGNKTVFRIINSTEGDTGIADDEFTNTLIFELDEAQNSFSVENDELGLLKVHYRQYCFCSETEFKAVMAGCLQGEKQSDNSWIIQGNLLVVYSKGNANVKFEAIFTI
jgi:hypothetical protein